MNFDINIMKNINIIIYKFIWIFVLMCFFVIL